MKFLKTYSPEGYINKKNIVFMHIMRIEDGFTIEVWTLIPEPMRTYLLTPPLAMGEVKKIIKSI